MKYLWLSLISLCALTACEKPDGIPPVIDGKALADRFVRPAGEQGIAAVVFNKEGNPIAVTADGKVLEPCRLPSSDMDTTQAPTDAKAAPLQECHGTSNTSIYGISQISAIRHKGSNCMTFAFPVDGYVSIQTFCW